MTGVDELGEPLAEERLHCHEAGDHNSRVCLNAGPEGDDGVVVRDIGRTCVGSEVDEADDGYHADAAQCISNHDSTSQVRMFGSLQESKGKEYEEKDLLAHREAQLENDRHGKEVDHEVGNDVQVRICEPYALAVAVRGWGSEIPERPERNAGDEDGDKDEYVIGHDDGHERPGAAADPRIGPNAQIEDQDGDLGEPQAHLIEENAVPASLVGVLAAVQA
jgi:hypothetical protein